MFAGEAYVLRPDGILQGGRHLPSFGEKKRLPSCTFFSPPFGSGSTLWKAIVGPVFNRRSQTIEPPTWSIVCPPSTVGVVGANVTADSGFSGAQWIALVILGLPTGAVMMLTVRYFCSNLMQRVLASRARSGRPPSSSQYRSANSASASANDLPGTAASRPPGASARRMISRSEASQRRRLNDSSLCCMSTGKHFVSLSKSFMPR